MLTVAAVACLAAPLARADSIDLKVDDPISNRDTLIHVTAHFSEPVDAVVVVRPRYPAGAPCVADIMADPGSDFGMDLINTPIHDGETYTDHWRPSPAFAGPAVMCAWLLGFVDYQRVVLATWFGTVNVRLPGGTIAVTLGGPASVRRPSQVTVSGTAEVGGSVEVKAHHGSSPCAATYAADSGEGVLGENVASGPFNITGEPEYSRAGPVIVCAWLVGPTEDQILAHASASRVVRPYVVVRVRSLMTVSTRSHTPVDRVRAGSPLCVQVTLSRALPRGTWLTMQFRRGGKQPPTERTIVANGSATRSYRFTLSGRHTATYHGTWRAVVMVDGDYLKDVPVFIR